MQVIISATLRSFFGRLSRVEAAGETVGEVLKNLIAAYPDAEKGLYDENGKLRHFVKVFVNKEDFTSAARHAEKLPAGAPILLLPLIAGGAPEEAQSIITEERRKAVSLNDEEIERYNKHLLLREISVKGQKRLKAARVAVVGAGALGAPVIQYLAAAGVGTIKVIDFDEVTLGNLQNQVIHGLRDIKRPKVASARDSIRNINKSIEVIAENQQVTADNAMALITGFDLVMDCSDNYKTRYLLNDACVLSGIPLVFSAIYQYEGLVSVFNLRGGPCLRCLFPEPPAPGLVPTCAEGGSISPLGGIIGSIAANEALKIIIGIGESLSGKLLTFDTLNLYSKVLPVGRDSACPICGQEAPISELAAINYEELCGLIKDETAPAVENITPEELLHRLTAGEAITIVDVREPHERAITRFPGAIVIPIGQLARRQKELTPEHDTVFICKEGQRSILAVNTLREAGYKGPLFSLKGGVDAMKDLVFPDEGGRL